ncbi:Transmembrane protein like [Fagus crenata]
MWGENCTQEVDYLSLVQSDPDGLGSEGARRYNQTVGSITYRNRTICTKTFDQNVYSLAVMEAIEQANPTHNYNITVVYLPISENVPSESANFYLEPYLSKSSYGDRSDYAWTYFLLNTTNVTEGNNIRIQLISDTKLSYELYVRLGGLPSLDMWDYRNLDQTSNKNNSNSMFKLYDTSQERINLYILYPTEGLWTIGLRHPVAINNHSSPQTLISILSETCPNQCFGHGYVSTVKSYCSCDRNLGGFDCSANLLSQSEQRWHSNFLIESNAAALLPAFKLLQQKACADWVIFMSSGIAIFMDFWLSFWAVVSTFVYLTVLSEAAKRTIHTVAVIITVLLAANGATKSTNIVIVLVIGASFLGGWLIQLSTRYKYFSIPSGSSLKIPERWQTLKAQFHDLRMEIFRDFRWGYVLLGFNGIKLG